MGLGAIINYSLGIIALILYYQTERNVLFWLCLVVLFAVFWTHGIMHNFAMDIAKVKRDLLLRNLEREQGGEAEINRLKSAPLKISKQDLNAVPNHLTIANMCWTILLYVLLVVALF